MSVTHFTQDSHPQDRRPAGQGDAADPLAQAIETMGVCMSFAKDEEIYGQGEDADLISRVVTGSVRTSRFMSDGRRQVAGFFHAGDVFGAEPGPEHRFSAEGLSDCTVQVLKRSALKGLADRDLRLERRLWALTVDELRHAQDHSLLLARKTACERVASFLLEMSDRFGRDDLELSMGRQDIADYLGLTIETVSRMLTQLQNSKLIEIAHSRTLKVRDRQGLIDLSE